MRRFAGLMLATLLAACGNGAGGNGQASEIAADGGLQARLAADQFNRDCLSAETQAPAGPMRAHLRRLCACGRARIAATPMSLMESNASINAKVQAANNACFAELGGAPGEGREAQTNRSAP